MYVAVKGGETAIAHSLDLVADKRRGDRDVEVSLPDVSAWQDRQPVLVDDIVSSARTMIQAVASVRRVGLPAPLCIGVHALFAPGAYEELLASRPARVLSCDTVPHPSNEISVVEPMARAVEPLAAWFTGRKRFQATTRNALPVFEAVGPRIRINPLAKWTTSDLADYMRTHQLRENPLVAYGYLSIGCFPCTQPVKPGEDARSGRWAGQAKTECGIHLSNLDESLTASSL